MKSVSASDDLDSRQASRGTLRFDGNVELFQLRISSLEFR